MTKRAHVQDSVTRTEEFVPLSTSPLAGAIPQLDCCGRLSNDLLQTPPVKDMVGLVDPNVDCDSRMGFSIGSTWFNSAEKTFYRCVDATAGSADWRFVVASKYSNDEILQPEARVGADQTRLAQATYEGASYRLDQRIEFNRLVCRVTATTGNGVARILLFQAPAGFSGVASRIGSFVLAPGGVIGTYALAPDTAGASLVVNPGTLFVLFGLYSGTSVTMRVYTNSVNDLLSQNVDTDTHPVTFSTTIPVNDSLPTTFDPRATPTGQAVPSTGNVILVLRVKEV